MRRRRIGFCGMGGLRMRGGGFAGAVWVRRWGLMGYWFGEGRGGMVGGRGCGGRVWSRCRRLGRLVRPRRLDERVSL